MPRPPLLAQRREQILEAFARGLARNGLARTTLDDVAREAGLQRAQLRHFVGNREELIRQLVDHLTEAYRRGLEERLEKIRRGGRLDALLDHLFPTGFRTDHADQDRVIDALRAATAADAGAPASLLRMCCAYEEELANEPTAADPSASPERVAEIAYALVCMGGQHAAPLALGFPKRRKRVLRNVAAARLAGLGQAGAKRAEREC